MPLKLILPLFSIFPVACSFQRTKLRDFCRAKEQQITKEEKEEKEEKNKISERINRSKNKHNKQIIVKNAATLVQNTYLVATIGAGTAENDPIYAKKLKRKKLANIFKKL